MLQYAGRHRPGDEVNRIAVTDLDSERFEATAALVSAARRLMLAVGTAEVGPREVDELIGRIDEVADDLLRTSRGHLLVTPPASVVAAVSTGETIESAAHNPLAVPLAIRVDGAFARGEALLDALSEGPPGYAHGGVVSWLLDCMLGTLLRSLGQQSVTASLDISYRRPTPLHVPLRLFAEIAEQDGRVTWVEGWIGPVGEEDQPTARARGRFVDLDLHRDERGTE